MKNAEKWRPERFIRNKKGRIVGPYLEKIIGYAYEPIIKKYSKGLLADIGSGEVPYYNLYKDKVTDNTCIDFSGTGLKTSYLDYDVDLNKGLPFLKENSFDTVLCTDVLEHIIKPELLFSEMARILKPNGHLILGVPFMFWIHDPLHDYHRYTHFKLREFCANNNLKIEVLNAYGGLPEIIFDLIHKGYGYYNFPFRKIFHFFWERWGYFLSRRKLVKRLSKNSTSTWPLGYVLVATKESNQENL